MAWQINNYNQGNTTDHINLEGFLVGNGVTNWNHDTIATMMDVAYYRSVLDVETYDKIVAGKCNN